MPQHFDVDGNDERFLNLTCGLAFFVKTMFEVAELVLDNPIFLLFRFGFPDALN
jgi:hypothetical protein